MALPLSPSTLPFAKPQSHPTVQPNLGLRTRSCECRGSFSDEGSASGNASSSLAVGSPIILVETPTTLKTADSMPCLKLNTGFVKQGDVGRIIARKPKDVWVVRLTMGTFLMDGKYFKPLDLEE